MADLADVKRSTAPTKQSETTVNVLDALTAYARNLEAAKGRFDACKFLLSALKWPGDSIKGRRLRKRSVPRPPDAAVGCQRREGSHALFDALHSSTGALAGLCAACVVSILAREA